MKLDLRYRPGGRAYKTCLSVFLCLLTGALLGRDSMFYAAIAAVICTQQTHEKTVNMGLHRLVGTVLGGAAGYGVLALLLRLPPGAVAWAQVVGIPLGCLVLIVLCNVLGRRGSVSICCIVFLSIVTHIDRDIPNTGLYVLTRILDTSVGILFAVMVDKLPFLADKHDQNGAK